MSTTTTTAGIASASIPAVEIVAMSRSSSPELDPVAVSEDLTPLPSLKLAGNSDIDFDGQLERPLRVREDVRSGCGGQTWPAGLVLGKHMLRYHRGELEDARILELGAGGGLVGLAVALACGGREGRSRLLLTDQDEMLELMQHNIRLNEVDARASALVLNWGEPLPDTVVQQRPNVILAAECVYFEPAFPLLMQTLKDLFVLNEDAIVYFCFKKRRRADLQFVKMAKKAFVVEELFDEDRPVFSRQSLFLFSFRSKRVATKANGSASKEANGHCSSNTTVRS
ncbi:Protein-lysine N-methyltransferase efm6 [Purpureocillium takamizusanense]|uniref:Protein-lysine N-methyltransferase EFM6 n=1 Tax=Purpureocillium takamizusanense TaxID=2060973 RepID=A0A9Q8VCL9_9HYPO|nr:Protein-lysine N-methyltransferase efm6 [Purpureocillium takamizusanense]UNI20823.1 Protein-lysine N-methyltransferase efm6 [Purpureocillium takamizusanense]